jgi:NADH dehydrogenase FAD-containing subunit
VTQTLQVKGQVTVFALGDVSAIDSKSAGRAARQAEVVVTNVRALAEGGRLEDYEPYPPAMVIPLGPHGGASELPGQDEIAGAEATATIKGEHMFVSRYRELFGLQPAPAVESETSHS